VTFTDPGFRIANDILQDGSDLCSNQVVPSLGTCTVNVLFAPTLSDAPNTIAATSYAISGTMIAAGTETASGYQNVLVVAENPVSATALVGSTTQGATLRPATLPSVSGWTDPADQNVYLFPKSSLVAETQQFTFKNYYSSSVVFPAYPQDMVLSDTQNFTVLNGTGSLDGCSGATVAPGGTCSLTVQFLPLTSPPAWNYPNTAGSYPVNQLYGTKITATGTVNGAFGPITFGGAAGTAGGINVSGGGCLIVLSTSNSCSFSVTITNNTGAVQTFSYTGGGTNGLSINSGSCTNVAANGGTCSGSGTFSYTNQCTPPSGGSCSVSGTVSISGTTSGGASFTASSPAGGGIAQCTTNCPGVPPGASIVVSVTGTEQATQISTPGSPATTQLTVTRTGHNSSDYVGLATFEIGDFTAKAIYRETIDNAKIASMLARVVNTPKSPVAAKVAGNIITLTSKAMGSAANMSFKVTAVTWGRCDSHAFFVTPAQSRVRFLGRSYCSKSSKPPSSGFTVKPSKGSLSGGADGGMLTQFDAGSVDATVGAISVSSKWGQADTPQTIAGSLATSLNSAANGTFTATATGSSVTITPTANQSKAPAVAARVNDKMGFNPASFATVVH